MARPIKAAEARTLLEEVFPLAESDYRDGAESDLPAPVVAAVDCLFASQTQAYRLALLGCAVARILDPKIDIRSPSTKSGDNAFSGRSLDEKAIMPFLRAKAIPIPSASPYLSSLRGGAQFVAEGQPRIQRDQPAFDSVVVVVDYLRTLNHDSAKSCLRYLLRRFIAHRERSTITLKKISKPNLDQIRRLAEGLLTVKSGGRIPSLLATAMFQTLSECYRLEWQVDYQGINVADKASGAVGDITISKDGSIILGVEVTERPVDQARVTLTFEQKISPGGLADYLFITTAKPEDGALTSARSYTAVGHEMNFVPLMGWLTHTLATIGPTCRALFQSKMIELLSAAGVPAELRVAWNEKMDAAIGVKPEDHP